MNDEIRVDLLFLHTMYDLSSGVRKPAVAGKSTSTKRARIPTRTVAMPSNIYEGANSVINCVQDLALMLTKIHDQPNRPAVPLMNEIANASNPEKAPARDAAPKKMPTRN